MDNSSFLKERNDNDSDLICGWSGIELVGLWVPARCQQACQR